MRVQFTPGSVVGIRGTRQPPTTISKRLSPAVTFRSNGRLSRCFVALELTFLRARSGEAQIIPRPIRVRRYASLHATAIVKTTGHAVRFPRALV